MNGVAKFAVVWVWTLFENCRKTVLNLLLASFIMCAYNVCPPVTCADPEPIPGSCCLGCPEIEPPKYERGCIDENQQSIRSRESWQADQCKTCMCIDGDISCTSQECEVDLTCDMLVLQKGKCCPICLGLLP